MENDAQVSSGDTNEFTPSEQEAMLRYMGITKESKADSERTIFQTALSHQVSSGDTNEFTPSEQEAILRHMGILNEPEATSKEPETTIKEPETTTKEPEADSEKTNPDMSSGPERIARMLANDNVEDDSQNQPSEIVRVTLEPITSNTLSLDIASFGTSEETVSPQGPIAFVEKLSLAHSHQDIGYNIQAAALPQEVEEIRGGTSSSEAFLLQLFFDPTSDRVVFVNMTQQPSISIQALVPSRQHVGSTPSMESVALTYLQRIILNVGSWIIGLGDQHQLNLTVIPRRYVSITPKSWNDTKNPAKRMLEISQPVTLRAKRGKKEKTDDELNALAVFRPAPAHKPAHPNPAPVDNLSQELFSDMRHPLEWLRVGEAAEVIGARGEDYTLIRNDDIAFKDGTLVFKAHHSSYSGKQVVVKVFRTTIDPAHDARASETIRCARSWLKEARNHFKVSQHSAVARLYDIDGRFLSLYMEHVDSPDLASYRERTINPLCTLTARDAERVLRDMSSALQYIHKKNIHHNDIKPENILYSKDRGAVLIDFGVSTADGFVHVGGSPWYVPPEFDKENRRGATGDVFALGVVMLFLLRMIPFPEKQTPRLMWIIADLKKEGPEARKARRTMLTWLEIVENASQELQRVSDEYINTLVTDMVKSEVKSRFTVDEILKVLQD